MAFPTYDEQYLKLIKTFNPEEFEIIRTEEGLFEVRVLFDGYADDEGDE